MDDDHRSLLERALKRTGPPVAVEARRHLAAEMGERHRSFGDGGRLEHREVAAALVAAPHHAEYPAIALGGIVAARHEDRLAEAVRLLAGEALALAGLEVVVGDA